jgi:cellulose synthase/poly-beta-1,6-N-acetylglucosamine synthase-like glycosyltransferase
MGIATNLAFQAPRDLPGLPPLCAQLVADSALCANDAHAAIALTKRRNVRLESILVANFALKEPEVCAALATAFTARIIDPETTPPDARLIALYGAAQVLRHLLLPWQRQGGVTIVLCSAPDDFNRHKDALVAYFGPVRMALTTPTQIAAAVRKLQDKLLVHEAEHQLPAADSSRSWNSRIARQVAIGLVAGLATLLAVAPMATLGVICLAVGMLVILTTGLKFAATCTGWAAATAKAPANAAIPARLPTITILVPLYKEVHITDHLLARLAALDYPHALLDVCLVLETSDVTTRDALTQADLPSYIRPIAVPDGTLKTKPRALNYAMRFAQGSIIGVYDAEDAPAPDQLRVVAAHFANCRRDVACLQGTLDYYNPRANWLTRCFTLEYASWFRVILPGYARLGLVVPLGGTTLFFKRDILAKLGGWDAHNVTEDADLGVRLARRGYRTEFIQSVTEEEANGRMWPWIKQRSRWLKGYAITYAVHMRNPLKLLEDLGLWRFLGVQILFGGTLAQFAFVPVIWSFWMMPLGLHHPVQSVAPTWLAWTFAIAFMLTGIINLFVNTLGAFRAGKPGLAPWALTLQLYFPLGMIAVYKGLLELTWKPFFWDKTAHGVLMPTNRRPLRLWHPASGARQKPR